MADLGRLLGTLLGSLAHARRIADEETAAIAEYYKNNPLLEGMSLPRIRVPELILDLPMIIEAHEEGEPNVMQEDAVIRKAVSEELRMVLERDRIHFTQAMVQRFEQEVKVELDTLKAGGEFERGYPRELAARAVDKALSRAMAEAGPQRSITQAQLRALSSALRLKASNVALKREGVPAKITASIISSEIKEKATANNVVRLKVSMKEEGLEWTIGQNEDGTVSQKLTPE